MGYIRKNPNMPKSCKESSPYKNVDLDEDIFFVETNNFLIIQEERLTQNPVVLRRVY